MGRGREDQIPSQEDLWQNGISLVQDRDCATFFICCLNRTVSLINAFILNSPCTLNCTSSAPTLTDQSNLVPKSNPNRIQNQGVSLPTDMLTLSSSSPSSMTSTPKAPGHPAEERLPVHTQCHDSETQDIPPVCPASRTGVRALSQGCHTLSLYIFQPRSNAKDSSPLRSVEIFSWLEGVSQPSVVELGKEAKLERHWPTQDTFPSSKISCQSFKESTMSSFFFIITPSFSPSQLYYLLKTYNPFIQSLENSS